MEFYQKLKELRTSHKFSRRELSELSGISTSSIEKYEYGLKEPSLEYTARLANIFNLEPIEFIKTLKVYKDLNRYIHLSEIEQLKPLKIDSRKSRLCSKLELLYSLLDEKNELIEDKSLSNKIDTISSQIDQIIDEVEKL